jgi:N-methylhydantoinase A
MTTARNGNLQSPWRVGIDVGGTFTDVVIADAGGQVFANKSPSIPRDPALGIIAALEMAAAARGLSLGELLSGCSGLVHGSTVATNTILEGKGARVGLLCTAGFRDALTIRRGIRPDPWRHRDPYPAPLVPRHLRMPVRGRITANGAEREALITEDIEAAMDQLAGHHIEALAIAFLHSYANPSHEIAARDLVAKLKPSLPIFLSSEVAPVIGEYARTSTTVAAAAVGPRLIPYLAALEQRLFRDGLRTPCLLMQSNGGLVTIQEVARNPACLLLSGPSGGVGALRWLAAAVNKDNLITMEMGGTSCDLILMHGGQVGRTDQLEVAGCHIRIPSVDIHTVSAGGGSIARVDAGGVMTLGPDGAGSDPGPAAYGRGGEQATDTDAQVVLGRLPAGSFAGGAIALDIDRARHVIDDRIGRRLNLSCNLAAAGIVRLQGQALVHAVERVSVERGYDPRRFSLVAVGGAAALHAVAVARRLGCREVLVPRLAGVFCAFGMLNADIRRDTVRSLIAPLSEASLQATAASFRELEGEIEAAFRREDLAVDTTVFERSLDIRYPGQQSSLAIAYTSDAAVVRLAFEAAHQSLYGHLQPGSAPEIAALRVTGAIAPPAIPSMRSVVATSGTPQPKAHRPVWMEGTGQSVELPIYAGAALQPGHSLDGPLVIEDATTTILLDAADRLYVDPSDTFIIEVAPAPAAPRRQQHEVAL